MSGNEPVGGVRGVAGAGRVVGLLGPTGVGKTAVAAELALLLGCRVISCDSMQVYRGFTVLTNQPTANEADRVPHELVGCVEPGEAFSAAAYAARARPVIEEELARNGCALLVGGTGLYMRAALAPLAVTAAGDPALRERLESRAARDGADALHADLARLDPEAARSIDPRNVRRVVRALETLFITGRGWSGRNDLWEPVYDHPTVVFGLVLERGELYQRIDARSARLLDEGAVEEVRRFRAERGEHATRPGGPGICSAIGYPEIYRYLEGRQTRGETVELIAQATRRYARRQMTWLRKVGDAVIIDVRDRRPRDVAQDILERVRANS